MTNSNDVVVVKNAAENKKANMDKLKKEGLVVTFRSKKAGREKKVDLLTMPWNTVLAVTGYGGTRFINDKVGGSEVTAADAAKAYDTIFDQMVEGWEGRQRGAGVDPVETKARSLARNAVKAALLDQGHKLKDLPEGKLDELSNNMFGQNPEGYKAEAEKLLEAERKQREEAAKTVDLEALGLKL